MAGKRARIQPVDRFRFNLKYQLQQRGFTQRSLAQAMGTGHTQVNRVLQGVQSPTVEWAGRAAEVLGVDVQDLFDDPALAGAT